MTGLLASELLKLRTTRAAWGLAVALLAITALVVAGVVGADALDDEARALSLADAAEASSFFALLLGILLVTNEFRHGTITATFLVTPARERVVLAKLVAAGVAAAVTGVAAAAVALAIALPWLSSEGEPLDLDADLLAAGGRMLAAFALSGVLGAAIGALVRSQVGAIVATFAWFFIVEPIAAVLPALAEYLGLVDDLDDDAIARYLPGAALDALVSTSQDELLSFPRALALGLAYTAGIAAVGIALVRRRDVE